MVASPRIVLALLCTLLCALLAPIGAAPAAAQMADEQPKLSVEASVDTSELERSGRFVLKLAFKVEKMVDRPFRVRLAIMSGETLLFRRDHVPPTRVSSWKAGETVRYPLPSLFPLNAISEEIADTLDIYVGLLDVSKKRDNKITPAGVSSRLHDQMRWVASFAKPKTDGGLADAAEAAVIARSKELLEAGDPRQAWDELEFALRRSEDTQQKIRLRKAIEALGHFPPREMTRIEQYVVKERIRREKIRYLRLWAGRMHDRKMYRGALKLLEEIGGSLEENNREAVIGALDEAKRVTQDGKSIRRRLINSVVKRDAKIVEELEQVKEWRDRERLLEIAEQLKAKGHHGAAWEAYRRAKDDRSEEVREKALKLWKELEDEIVEGDGVPQAELDEIEKAKTHPAWDRTWAAPTHRFILIGPKAMIEGILKNKEAVRRFDLAYVLQTDLFGRSPNPGGTRITVYFKELWDFGGGQAGGNLIDIGKASPEKTSYRVDTGLMYHELTHCVYTFKLGYPGFNEGIANFGACFTFDMLGQKSGQVGSLRRNLEDFREDYAGRDMAFWRIQKYGPSAGFFLHFIDKYGRKNGKLDWQLYRLFFRGFNQTPVRDSRPRMAIRAIGYYLMKVFGEKAFDDLIEFRFPLEASDKEALADEMDAEDEGFPEWAKNGAGHGKHPNSPRLRDFLYKQLLFLRQRPAALQKRFCSAKLGHIYDWKVCGPFLDITTNRSFTEVFAPEMGEIDFEKRYDGMGKHTGVWRDPSPTDPSKYVHIAGDGWVTIDYPYGDWTSSYCYTRLNIGRSAKIRIHLRTENHFTVWLNGKLLHKMKNIGQPGSAPTQWRYNRVPDEFAVKGELQPGENVLMIKVSNERGKAGFVCSVVGEDNRPLPDLRVDTQPPTPSANQTGKNGKGGKGKPKKKKWKKVATFTDRALGSVMKAKVGRFSPISRNKEKRIYVGTDTRKRVAWRKYTVRPGFPKDSPSNLVWLPKGLTRGLGASDFRIEMVLQMDGNRLPKMTLTFDGNGSNGGLEGWTFIFSQAGNAMSVRLEKYDHIFYSSPKLKKITPDTKHTIVVERTDELVTLTVNGVVALKNIHCPKLRVEGAERIGFATWNKQVGFQTISFARR